MLRDRRIDTALNNGGWTVVRIWQHEPAELAVERVLAVLEG
jgi:very-short-patch-repair endonuclease